MKCNHFLKVWSTVGSLFSCNRYPWIMCNTWFDTCPNLGGGYSQRKIQVFNSYYIKLPKIVPPFPSKRIFSLWGNFLYPCMWCCTYMYMFIDHHSFSQIEEQKKYLSKNVCHIGLGTPNRICSLLKSGRDFSVNRDS